MTFEQRRDAIVNRIKGASWFKRAAEDGEDIGYLIDDLATSKTTSEFDEVWSEIYDWADTDHRVWIWT